jgi:hypothetical protein
MPKRKPARPGLSYVDANRGRLITVDNDVLGIKAEIESRWPMLEVTFDTIDEVWCIIAHDDTVDYLAINPPTPYLDQRIIRRLERADKVLNPTETGDDVLAEIDKFNAEVEREEERRFEDQIGDFGERFKHALKQDGVLDHCNVENRPGPRRRRESHRVANRA